MKKLGTPIGAAPGSANENVGFEGVGVPPAARGGGFGVDVVRVLVDPGLPLPPLPAPRLPDEPLLLDPEPFDFPPPPRCVDGFWVWVGPGCGVDCVEPGVEEVGGLGAEEVEGEDEVGGGVGGGEVQDSEVETTGRETGSDSAETGVPAGTLTVKVRVLPPTTVTVTTHVSADAVGRAAIPDTASTVPAVATAILTFLRVSNWPNSSRRGARACHSRRDHTATPNGRY